MKFMGKLTYSEARFYDVSRVLTPIVLECLLVQNFRQVSSKKITGAIVCDDDLYNTGPRLSYQKDTASLQRQ